MMFWILWVIAIPWLLVLLPTKMIGKKYLKSVKNNASIFACNHQSNNDAVILKTRVNTKFKFMAKDSLFRKRFNNWFFRKIDMYPVQRGGNDIEAVKKTLTYLRNNQSIVIFPEGTRVKEGESTEFKNGLVLFAIKSDCYVIPAVFRKKPKFFRLNTLVIGKPFKFSEYAEFQNVKPTKDILQNASDMLSSKMNELKVVNLKEYKKEIKEEFKKKK